MDVLSGGAATSAPKYLKDYTSPPLAIDKVEFCFNFGEDITEVTSKLSVRLLGRTDERDGHSLTLDGGADVELVALKLDGAELSSDSFCRAAESLTINDLPSTFVLTVVTHIKPQLNTRLEGLYKSSGKFCTQCEAEGFRHITFYPDRPDVMARFKVRIEAEQELYPILLSNGNPVQTGSLEGGRHFAVWDDPFPKPSYLFALVAGNLKPFRGEFNTQSGRNVALNIWVEEQDLSKCAHAMQALKNSMLWDEQTWGLEYDLDIYNIVAVSDFNMGAMENKGLNIFNTKCILASDDSATDMDFSTVERVVGHEYFHNWTGNRVTCRDWFQLSLKEGLTVFRDQEFSSDMGSRGVKRIDDVRLLRSVQFPEDAGPMAHPVRPESYVEINNFYTATIYNKGAEVIRMMQCLIGKAAFRKGLDVYIERHDGQAVTCEDFVCAMEAVSEVNLQQFRLWYSQAGTPQLTVNSDYDALSSSLSITLSQLTAATPNQLEKHPFHIPVMVALFDQMGNRLRLNNGTDDYAVRAEGTVLELKSYSETFIFHGIKEKPLVSVLRGFTAPVIMTTDRTRGDELALLACDDDAFARWDVGQAIAAEIILGNTEKFTKGDPPHVDQGYIEAMRAVLLDEDTDAALRSELLTLPPMAYLIQLRDIVDIDALIASRNFLREKLGQELHQSWLDAYQHFAAHEKISDLSTSRGDRALKNTALCYLAASENTQWQQIAEKQYYGATNLTDRLAALGCFMNSKNDIRHILLENFFSEWQNDPLVIDKWFTVQALAEYPDALADVIKLADHTAFSLMNPNRVRSLVASFAAGNLSHFHDISGAGYNFLATMIVKVDRFNPQLAARLVSPLGGWRKYDDIRASKMKTALASILENDQISADVKELVNLSIQGSKQD